MSTIVLGVGNPNYATMLRMELGDYVQQVEETLLADPTKTPACACSIGVFALKPTSYFLSSLATSQCTHLEAPLSPCNQCTQLDAPLSQATHSQHWLLLLASKTLRLLMASQPLIKDNSGLMIEHHFKHPTIDESKYNPNFLSPHNLDNYALEPDN